MSNKSINQLPAGGAVAATDEFERQAAGGGASLKCTAGQLTPVIQALATSFAQGTVSFANIITARTLNLTDSLTVAGSNISLSADGSASFAVGKITFATDGSANFADGSFAIKSDGGLAAGISYTFNADGSGTLASGVIIFSSSGDVEITDTTKGFIQKSPNGTRYRIKVDDAGNLGTEAA